jgi:drug/metabolite transporter (DMT)-like permease
LNDCAAETAHGRVNERVVHVSAGVGEEQLDSASHVVQNMHRAPGAVKDGPAFLSGQAMAPSWSVSPARYLVLATALLAIGLAAPLIRLAVAPALAVALWRTVFAWPALATVAAVRRERWPLVFGVPAGVFLALHWYTWIVAVQTTTIASAGVLVCTGSLWTALLSRPLLNEEVPAQGWLGLAVALGGVALVVTTETTGQHSLFGDLMALAASLAWVGYTFVGRRGRERAGFWGYTATVYGVTAVLFVAIAVGTGQRLAPLAPTAWLAVGGLALFPTLVGHGGLNYLLRHIGPAQLSLWTLVEPVLAVAIAFPLFGEVPALQEVLGGLVTLAGVGLGVWRRPRAA